MLKWLRENNKKILAILGVFLMIAFIIPTQTKRGGLFGGDRPIGTIGKQKIGSEELADAEAEWKALSAVLSEYARRSGGQILPLGDFQMLNFALNEGVDATSYLLLVKQAEQMQILPNRQYVDQVAKTLIDNKLVVPNLESALLHWHMVVDAFETRIAPAVRLSPAVTEWGSLNEKQQVELGIIAFKADDFRKELAASPTTQATTQPTEKQLADFFDKYKDQDAGAGDLGFGYRYPKRLSLQYLMIPKDAIRARLKTDTDLYDAYLDNQSTFMSVPEEQADEPTTQPTTRSAGATQPATPDLAATRPTTAPALAKAATRPTTQPRQLAFDELTPTQLDNIRDQLAERGAVELARKIFTRMSEQYTRFHQADKEAIPNSDVGVRYDTPEYLQKLAGSSLTSSDATQGEAANSWHDVHPLVNQEQIGQWLELDRALRSQWLTEPAARVLGNLDLQAPADSSPLTPLADLSSLPGLGRIPTFGPLGAFYGPFLTQAQVQQLEQDMNQRMQIMAIIKQSPDLARYLPQVSRPLGLWEPSDPLRDSAGNYYIFRIVRADTETVPPSFAEYNNKEQVRRDYIQYQAYELAKAKATECFKKLQTAVADKKIDPEHPFQVLVDVAVDVGREAKATEYISNERGVSPRDFALSTQGSEQFRKGAFDLLRERLKTGREFPVALIEVPYDKCVAVVELMKSRGGVVDYQRLAAAKGQILSQVEIPALQSWFDPEDIKKRMDFQPSADFESHPSNRAPGRAPLGPEPSPF